MKSADIRKSFINYFQSKGHEPVASSSLIPSNDPTLFFVNAGMVQFKDCFLGKDQRNYTRATSAQKCLRVSGKHNDLENVGVTPRHHTLFEMLGNFSFGDYFKEEAISFAWDFLTKVLNIDKSKLWITIYEKDDEAEQIWTSIPDVDPQKIQRLGEKDNFWSMGDTGPCGPCTEIHYDHGPEYGDDPNGPAGETDRYVEIWNLVFMQFNRDEHGTLHPLPNPSIDTGMGLERVAAILQGVYTNYDTDVFQDIIQETATYAGIQYGAAQDSDIALRVIADHIRAVTFLIADGVMPSNEGRGYVLRRITRRAIRYGVRINLKEPFLYRAAQIVIRQFSSLYPELEERKSFLLEVIKGEEERFAQTLERGLQILEEACVQTQDQNKRISGDTVFTLHDTFGFPMDLTRLIAQEKGFSIDEEGFHTRMAEQKAAGRANWKGSGQESISSSIHELAKENPTTFVGYTTLSHSSNIQKILDTNHNVVSQLSAGSTGYILVERTPFYAEGGGQTGDTGTFCTNHAKGLILDTQKPLGSSFFHHVQVESGTLQAGTIELEVDQQARFNIRRNHTATHILHSALRNILGTHVAQKGSLVQSDRFRFDFSHHKPLTAEERETIQSLVQQEIFNNTPLDVEECTQEEAKEKGALALFGEKYGDTVRVVSVPGFSTELCGGTHVKSTGEIGAFHILSESGVAAGVRRIEAVTGLGAIQYFQQQEQVIRELSGTLKVPTSSLSESIHKILDERKKLEKEVASLQLELAKSKAGDLKDQAREINGVTIIAAEFGGDPKTLRSEADRLRDSFGSAVIVLGSRKKGVQLIVAVTKDLTSRVHAGKLIKEISAIIDGKGGGRPDMAQAGGKSPDKLPQALDKAYDVLEGLL